MRPGLVRIATAGNAAALVLLVAVLANARLLFGPSPVPAVPPAREAAPGRVLLVVIDALREDSSRDLRVMPNLVRLAGEGGRGVALVESLIPSTVAGIRTIAEGVVPEPASFLHDFGTTPSRTGGIFAAVHPSFAAGPRLWADLYGPWLSGSEIVGTVSGDDARVLAAGLAALDRGGTGLVVVHLSETDDAAHLHGARAREYGDALRRADAALGRLVERAGPDTAVVVTSDHGVTASGGHAGPEEDVVRTPVVVRGPGLPRGDLGTLRQRDLHRLIVALPARPSRAPSRPWLPAFGVVLALAGCLGVCRQLVLGAEGRHAATWLDAALWIGIALAVAGLPWAAILLALAALGRVGTIPTPRLALAALAVVAFGGLRLLDARLGPAGPDLGLPVVCVLGAAAGYALRGRGLDAGLLCGLLPAVLARLLGETASLSTLDVRLAFRLADGLSGLAGAVAIVILLQALPTLALLFGVGRPDSGAFVSGLALAVSGQAAAVGIALAFAPADLTTGSLATGLLVRLVGETTFLFLGSLLFAFSGTITPRSGRSRLPAATTP
ncbi:MAG TPA: alkaline phosphatase family protein [Thermoanaerobaculia bacterium]|nr:alkaline phosphatase family protein [Thermoanaerobaculia bacterium]